MISLPRLDLAAWQARYSRMQAQGRQEPWYGGPLERHLADGDVVLERLRFDDSWAALRLWNFLLTEELRLRERRAAGWKIIGTLKDLGTVPVLAYALPRTLAFYPDGAWWLPCIMDLNSGALAAADRLGLGPAFCPVRAMLGAFVSGTHFPRPDLVTCPVGATCDDVSAIAQRIQGLGFPLVWWEMPHRRRSDPGEPAVGLPGGLTAPAVVVDQVAAELCRVGRHLTAVVGEELDDACLTAGIANANAVRRAIRDLRQQVLRADRAPLPALELQIVEMLAIHFCSDRDETLAVVADLTREVEWRIAAGEGHGAHDDVRIYWVNPVADLAALNLVEDCGARVVGSDYMIGHALEPIPEDMPPYSALARIALADPLVGPASDRARLIVADAKAVQAEAVVISRIPGASHCAWEGEAIGAAVRSTLDLPVVELEVPPLMGAVQPALTTRLQALVELARSRRMRS